MPKNTTTVVPQAQLDRVYLAMQADGTKVYAEFVRSSLLWKCREIERRLREENPAEYCRLYSKTDYFDPPAQKLPKE